MNINTIKRKLFMDKHHRMEHFGMMFIIFLIIIAMFIAVSAKVKIANSKYQMTSASIVGSNSTFWSKTGSNMSIEGTYSNADNTKFMIWLKMDDMSKSSTDPNEYSIYVSPYKDMSIKHPLTGSLYMFGDTGNMALMLYDNMGFENVVMEITMRGTAIVEDPDFESPYTDPSYETYNQSCFYVNPSGTDAEVVDFLDEDIVDTREMYYTGALFAELSEAKATLDESMTSLKEDMAVYSQCIRVLDDADFVTPTVPAAIVSDFISTNPVDAAKSPVTFDANMLDLDDAVINSEHGYMSRTNGSNDPTGNDTANNDVYYYVSDFVYPGGLNVSVNDIDSIEEIYNSLKPAGSTFYEWKSDQDSIAKKYDSAVGNYTPVTTSWQQDSKIYQYGTVERYDKAIDNYNTAVSNLLKDKETYQTEDIYKIFECVSQLDTVADKVTINSNNDFLTKWQHY